MSTEIKINDHPFYKDPRFVTEKIILERLTQICGFDTTIGVIDYFPGAPSLEIGFINEKVEKEEKMPIFENDSKITIYLNSDHLNPFVLPKDLSFEVLRKIVTPLIINWVEVATFLVNFYASIKESHLSFSLSSLRSLEVWKKNFSS